MRVLLAEDEMTSRKMVSMLLTKLGASEVVAVEDGRSACERVLNQGEQFDLVGRCKPCKLFGS